MFSGWQAVDDGLGFLGENGPLLILWTKQTHGF